MLLVNVNGDWKQIHELKSVPELGETPNRIDATSLESEVREYIGGLADQGDFEFTFNAMPVNAPNSNIALMMGLNRKQTYDFIWRSPRLGVQMLWTAEFNYRFGAGEVDSVRDFIIALVPHSKPVESLISKTYTIKFNSNGGSGSMSDIANIPNGTEKDIPNCTFTNTGKTFVFWNTREDRSGESYDANDKITVYSDVTLYAIWSD